MRAVASTDPEQLLDTIASCRWSMDLITRALGPSVPTAAR
jgi:hypothetical protein